MESRYLIIASAAVNIRGSKSARFSLGKSFALFFVGELRQSAGILQGYRHISAEGMRVEWRAICLPPFSSFCSNG